MEDVNPALVSQDAALLQRLRYLPTGCMVLLFLFGIAVFVHFWGSKDMADHRRQTRPLADFLQGREALALEHIYKNVFPIRDFSVGLVNTISFRVFGEARKGLIKGEDGWLFTDEEFSWNRTSAGMVAKHLDFVRQSVSRLKNNGVEPIILLVPEKADIYRDKLGSIKFPYSREGYYHDIQRQLIEMGVSVPDLRAAFLTARKSQQVFLMSDTHWTVEGAGIAARTAAEILARAPDLRRTAFQLTPDAEIIHRGDLYKFANFGMFPAPFPMNGDRFAPLTAKASEASLDDLLSDAASEPEVAIVGSSYSANALWSFEAQLKHATSVDVINFAEEGKGPFTPMETFLEKDLPGRKEIKYVLWEIPLRYIDEAGY